MVSIFKTKYIVYLFTLGIAFLTITTTAYAADYFYCDTTSDHNPLTLTNYFNDNSCSDPATQLPNLSTDSLTIQAGAIYTGNVVLRNTSALFGEITGNADFYDDSFTEFGSVIGGDATFHDNTGNASDIGGDVTFYNANTYTLGGTIGGTKTRYYNISATTTLDFVSDGPWTVVADGVVVNITGATTDGTTTLQTLNGGSFTDLSFTGSTISGATITLTYDHTLDTGSVPSVNDYTVLVNGNSGTISSVSVSGTTVILTLASAVAINDTVTVSYTNGTNDVQSNLGEKAADLSNQSVTRANPPTVSTGGHPFYTAVVGSKLYVTSANTENNYAGTSVFVININTGALLSTITVGDAPTNLVLIGNKLYVLNFHGDTVSVINTVTDTVSSTISVGASPYYAIPSGNKLYVVNYQSNTLSVINSITDTVTATITTPKIAPYAVAVVGTKLYVSMSAQTDSAVAVYNTLTDTLITTIEDAGSYPAHFAVYGTKIYASNPINNSGGSSTLDVIDTTTDTVSSRIAIGGDPGQAVIVGSRLYLANNGSTNFSIINTTTDTVIGTVSGFTAPFSPTVVGHHIYVGAVNAFNISTVSVIDTNTNIKVASITTGDSPQYLSFVNNNIYAANVRGATVSIIDTTSLYSLLPNLTSFSTSASSGTYDTGDSMTITANFGRSLASGSTMTVLLNSGRSVTLNSVSGSTLSGTYTVQSGDASPDLAVESITSASVTDTNGHNRTSYDLPSSQGSFTAENSFITRNLGDTKNIVINTGYDSIAVGDAPYQISASINGYIYIANQGAGTVSVVRVSDNTLVDTITVGDEPYGLAAVGTKLYVANTDSNTVSVIDTTTNTVSATISAGVKPYYVAVVGTTVYVTNGASNSVSVINSATDTVTDTISVGSYPRGIKAYGTDLYVANYGNTNYSGGNYISVIDSTTNEVTDTVILPAGSDGPRGVSSLGTNIYVTNYRSDNVSVINTATNAITDTISVGAGPRGIVGLGTKVYVENFDDGTISIIDTGNANAVTTLDVGHSPSGMSIVGTDIYVSAFQDDLLRILDTTTGELKIVADTTAPTLAEVTPVPTPSTTTTPSYAFSSDEAGTITYGGSCSSATTAATVGTNTITFTTLNVGTYSDCTITVTDSASNASTPLAITTFTITQRGGSSGSYGPYSTGCLPPDPNTPDVEGPCLGVMIPPALPPTDCLPGYLFSPSTGLSCTVVGCAPGQSFSSVTGLPCPTTLTGGQTTSHTTTTPSALPAAIFTRTLKFKTSGPDVKALQQALNTVLKLPKPLIIDGIFGNNTLNALKMFQKEKGLVQDGVFGKKSREAISKI